MAKMATIYVKDQAAWERAKHYAEQTNVSMSHLIELALRAWVEKPENAERLRRLDDLQAMLECMETQGLVVNCDRGAK